MSVWALQDEQTQSRYENSRRFDAIARTDEDSDEDDEVEGYEDLPALIPPDSGGASSSFRRPA